MAVRVLVRVKATRGDMFLETAALINTGFETDGPDIVLPVKVAERLGLWPPPSNSIVAEYGTVAGDVILVKIDNSIEVQVVADDRRSRNVVCNALVSTREDEVLVSDYVADELEVAVVRPRAGWPAVVVRMVGGMVGGVPSWLR